jgi:hypothetical protein
LASSVSRKGEESHKEDSRVNPEKWYSVKEVSDFIGLSEDTIRRQIGKGFLKAFRLPEKSSLRRRVYKVFRILGSEVLRWMREHTS